ncbi:MAG: hypothetical protein Roseis2KO_52900 [Roseivirga sp.]
MNSNNTPLAILLLFSAVISFWDAFTTFVGIDDVIGSSFIALVFTVAINGLLYSTFRVWNNDSDLGILGIVIKIAWLISIICDLYTSYLGNMDFSGIESAEPSQAFILVCFTFITSVSPIIVSYLVFKKGLLNEFV